jgi:hypothetical protein
VNAGLREEVLDELLATVIRERDVGKRRFECAPVLEAELARERMLHVAQSGLRGGAGPHSAQALACPGIVVTKGVQPAFGFFTEILETALRGELADHVPSFRCCPKSA